MRRNSAGEQRQGFTLIEVLVVVAIISIIAAIVYASTGSVREKARQTTCISNLRQIGQALAMYRQDWNGSDTPGWPATMGLPAELVDLAGRSRSGTGAYLAGGSEVLLCPDDPLRAVRAAAREASPSYGYNTWVPDPKASNPDGGPLITPLFPDVVARRGSDFPLVYCGNHNYRQSDRPPLSTTFHIVLRLDGRVDARWSAQGNSWEW